MFDVRRTRLVGALAIAVTLGAMVAVVTLDVSDLRPSLAVTVDFPHCRVQFTIPRRPPRSTSACFSSGSNRSRSRANVTASTVSAAFFRTVPSRTRIFLPHRPNPIRSAMAFPTLPASPPPPPLKPNGFNGNSV